MPTRSSGVKKARLWLRVVLRKIAVHRRNAGDGLNIRIWLLWKSEEFRKLERDVSYT